MEWIKGSWRGETPLWKAFWIYGVVFSVIFSVVIGIIIAVGFGAYTISQGISAQPVSSSSWMVYALTLVPFLWPILAAIMIWKCAFNTNLRLWGYLARMIVVLFFADACFNIYLIATGAPAESIGIAKSCKAQTTNAADNFTCQCTKEMEIAARTVGMNFQEYSAKNPDAIQKCVQSALDSTKGMRDLGDKLDKQFRGVETQLCQKTMTDTAQKSGVDPQKYIADNQAYLQQCVKYYTDHPPQPDSTKKP